MMSRILSAAAALGAAAYASGPLHVPEGIVDLGYAVHQGAFNATGNFYAYHNIRYAEPPLGYRRFKPPVAVMTVNRTINNGYEGAACIQSFPWWQLEKMARKMDVPVNDVDIVLKDFSAQSEDCLFLDVYTPRTIDLERRAPVVVRIPDVNFVHGLKNLPPQHHEAGMIARSQENGGEGIVFVSFNYRLGMYGWLNGGDDRDVFPNVGLQDQRMALQWVKRYIHVFGGNGDDITVIGHTAGGASIMHHLTAKGGREQALFNRAIIQSPSFETTLDASATWERTLKVASDVSRHSIRNGGELAALTPSVLREVNDRLVADSRQGSFTFGPTVDGDYVPDLPGILLRDGKFDASPSLMIGHNSNDWLDLLEVNISRDDAAQAAARDITDIMSDKMQDTIKSELYPEPSETKLYSNETERCQLLVNEFSFTCNVEYLSAAFGAKAWNYRFEQPPGFHGQDIAYTFYNGYGNSSNIPTDGALAEDMQRYFTNFAQSGNPNSFNAGYLPHWPEHNETRVVVFGPRGISTDAHRGVNSRCSFWQSGAYRD